MEQPPSFFALAAEKYMLFKGSNHLVQIYRSFSITTEGGAFLNMVILM
jgi:hypothetical protein